MCGIYGWLDPSVADVQSSLLAMGDTLVHRGPDDRGVHIAPSDGLALGHNRLSIIDLSTAAHQPMFGEDESVVLTFNGEIYNFRELRDELTSAGHRFHSRTDSEVLVHGYEEWGQGVLDRLAGMFAFALWDAREKLLFLARDPMGMKPLYYWRSRSGGFYFASEIKGFLRLRGFEARLNPHALRQYLETNFIYDLHETSLEDVLKVPAGHFMRVRSRDLASGGAVACERYYSPPESHPWVGGESEIAERADRLFSVLDTVVGQHLNADVPVGLLLSGGLDSSLVAAFAARRQPIRTISMGFADSTVDERPFARVVAEHLGTVHEEVLIRPEEVVSDLKEAVWWVDDLFGDWGVVSTRILYHRCSAAGLKVALVGEGADEVFGGYPQHAWSAGSNGRTGWLSQILRLYQGYSGRRWGRGLPEFARTFYGIRRNAGGDAFDAVRLFECQHQLPNCYNMKVDKASMAASMEARVPFLDVRVVAEGLRVPKELLFRNGTNKHILRYLAERHNLLPRAVLDRPKYGASIAASWLDAVPDFRRFARDVVLDRGGWAAPLGLQAAMEDYFLSNRQGYRFPKSVGIFSIVAWRLLMLNLWSTRYLGSRRTAA